MKLTTLGDLITNIDDYDENRPIFVAPAKSISAQSKCLVVIGNSHPCVTDFDAVPEEARAHGMVRFLSSGQLQDVEGALYATNEDYGDDELISTVSAYYEAHVRH